MRPAVYIRKLIWRLRGIHRHISLVLNQPTPCRCVSPHDVRFTPPNLARALVQKALEAMDSQGGSLTVLDPACGSGVFLVEAIRELSIEGERSQKVKAIGYDISDISAYTTQFCLEYATHNAIASRDVQTEVIRCDSLDRPWVNANVILMNPPFIHGNVCPLNSNERSWMNSVIPPGSVLIWQWPS